MGIETLDHLRSYAVGHTFFTPLPLPPAVERLAFVQADPIRAPARAEDLVLRHRVAGYREGELARSYAEVSLEEGYLYAYGYMPRTSWDFVRPLDPGPLRPDERAVLAAVREMGRVHPRALDERFGQRRAVNPWGGQSRVTKLALEQLHYRGLLRVAGREKGVRLYEPAPAATPLAPLEKLRGMLRMAVRVLAPIRQATLLSMAARFRKRCGATANHRAVLDALCKEELVRDVVDGVPYIRPDAPPRLSKPQRLRILAPFDPLVWDRARFQHLWAWEYRFEAYTPQAKRVRGYYAMPLLWLDRVIGWANVERRPGGLDVKLGFAGRRPDSRAFRSALDEELSSFEAFLTARGG